MVSNSNQPELTGIDRLLSGLALSDHIRRSFNDRGLKTVAQEIESDPAELSRYLSGQCGLTLVKLEKLLEQEGLVVVRRQELRRIMLAWLTSTEMMHRLLWSESHES